MIIWRKTLFKTTPAMIVETQGINVACRKIRFAGILTPERWRSFRFVELSGFYFGRPGWDRAMIEMSGFERKMVFCLVTESSDEKLRGGYYLRRADQLSPIAELIEMLRKNGVSELQAMPKW